MTTYTTKIAKNGSVRYYDAQTGKAIAKKTALENERNYIRTNGTTKERYELAKETYRVDNNGKIEKFGWHKELRRDSSGFYHVEVRGWYNHCGTEDYDFANDMQEEFGLTIDEFKAEATAEANTETQANTEETAAEEIVEVETEVEPALDFNAEPEGTAPNAKKFIKAALDTEPERYQQVATARKEVVASPVEATAMTKLDTLKEKRAILRRAFFSALKDHYVKHNDEFFDAAESGYTTFGVGDHTLYRKDGGKFVEVDDKAFDALNRLEIKLDIAEDAVNAEIAKTQFKFESGKYYVNDEGNKFFCIKRNKKSVKFFDCAFTQDDGFMDLDADEDDDWERKVFKCKIQFDERGEFVDWYEGDPDDDGDRDLITILAKNVTDPPETEHDPEHEDEDDKPGTESKPDDFTAELLKLKSEQSAAKNHLDEKEAELLKAQNEHQAAQDAWNKTNRAVENLYRAKAEELSAKLLPLRKSVLEVKTQDGFQPFIALDTVTISLDKGKFAIHGDCSEKIFFELARYDTPAQVEAAINGLKATDALGGDRFTFPHNEELNASTADKFKSAVKTEIKAAQKIVRTKRAELILARVNGESTEQAQHELDLAYLKLRGLENLIANSEEVIA